MLTTLDLPATIVAVVWFCDSGVPVPFVLAYRISVNVSVPIGAVTVTEHVLPPPLAAVQLDEFAATFAITGVPPLTATDTDWVFMDTYCGLRCLAEGKPLAGAGTEIEMTALALPAAVGLVCGTDEPPPPHPDKSATRKVAAVRRRIIPSIFREKGLTVMSLWSSVRLDIGEV
jgi:hypothetical protein